MVEDKLRKLIDRLLVRTRAGELQWSETSSQDAFQASFPSYSLELERADTTIYIRVLNSEGKVLEWTSDQKMRTEGNWKNADDIRKLDELYALARRQALRVEKALDELLSVIG